MSTILTILNSPAPDDTSNKKELVKHMLVEFVGATLFIFMGTLSAASTQTKLGQEYGEGADVAIVFPIAFAFGVSITVLAFSIGHISGCHLNPGVSLLMYFKRQMSGMKMLCYWLAQFLASMLASTLVWGCISGNDGSPHRDGSYGQVPFNLGITTLNADLTVGNGFLLELLGSFFFYFVIAQTALDKKGIARSDFPAFPIGFSLVVVHICLIPFTGCGVNPARTFGPAMVICMSANGSCAEAVGDYWWIYWVGPFAASFLVAEMTNLLSWETDVEATITAQDTPVTVPKQKNQLRTTMAGLTGSSSSAEDHSYDEEVGQGY